MDLSRNFNRSEFACRCGCGFDTVDFMLVMVLEDLRNHFRMPVIVTGKNRCKKRNSETPGASPTSTHMSGKAADVRVVDVPEEDVADYLEMKYPGRFGIGRYIGRTHIDVRSVMKRWNNTGRMPSDGYV